MRSTNAKRKEFVEPVLGQIKKARGIRRFWLRGLAQVRADLKLICATHNRFKPWRRGGAPGLGCKSGSEGIIGSKFRPTISSIHHPALPGHIDLSLNPDFEACLGRVYIY